MTGRQRLAWCGDSHHDTNGPKTARAGAPERPPATSSPGLSA
ncbi:hypothetical protein C882_2006 [Caenispirillum salinarum AK4]|uniref:Uncharacterized protein n=1 Tax=Caenispirillum salinarum AK4 TaxID=1238182 RepID=K9GPN5_9PROT|nr:hypothetical protein C882_2006 [Caenispirillum salinarum AK4]